MQKDNHMKIFLMALFISQNNEINLNVHQDESGQKKINFGQFCKVEFQFVIIYRLTQKQE